MGRTVSAQLTYGFYVDDEKRWNRAGDDPPPLLRTLMATHSVEMAVMGWHLLAIEG